MHTDFNQETVFYPLTADPLGFHHLAAVEWLLRNSPSKITKVVLLISNGQHPDPQKASVLTATPARLSWAKKLLQEAPDKNKSALARVALIANQKLTTALEICERELKFNRAVHLTEHLTWLKSLGIKPPFAFLAGADLLQRLSNPDIFSDAEIILLAKNVNWQILARAPHSLTTAIKNAQQRANALACTLQITPYPLGEAPPWLHAFLGGSSQAIRRCAQAGDALTGMVSSGLVKPLLDSSPSLTSTSPLQQDWAKCWHRLLHQARQLHQQLLTTTPSPLLSINETSSGGLISHSLLAFSNSSRYFHQASIPYSKCAQQNFLSLPYESTVNQSYVSAVAEKMLTQMLSQQQARQQAGTNQSLLTLAESGMAGPPDGKHHSTKNGKCWLALASKKQTVTHFISLHPFQTRLEHQLEFATQAVQWLQQQLKLPAFQA